MALDLKVKMSDSKLLCIIHLQVFISFYLYIHVFYIFFNDMITTFQNYGEADRIEVKSGQTVSGQGCKDQKKNSSLMECPTLQKFPY
jgi:hypothetical protein